MMEPKAVEFTDPEIRLVIASLPDTADARRCELLPQILRDWGRLMPVTRLTPIWEEPPPLVSQRRKRLAKIGKAADELLQMIANLDLGDLLMLEMQIGRTEGIH